MAHKVYRLSVISSAAGMRLDQYLAAEAIDLTRNRARKIIDLGGVHIDGRRVGRCSYPVRAGQNIEIYLDGRSLAIAEFSPGDILFQDRYLLAVNKPAGMDFQPTHARFKGTVYEAILRYLSSNGGRKDINVGMVQRLDRDTSGVAIFSIHPRAHRGLTEQFKEHRVQKFYRALVEGRMPNREGRFSSLLARQRRTNLMKSVARGGKEAVTEYRVVEEFDRASLVEVEIPTGRSHQIRVHFSEAGHPLLGDTRYGAAASIEGTVAPRQMLHAFSLSLVHPVTGAAISLTAPIPEDMQGLIEKLRRENIE
jgi:23S rRNA pseudouridine1911/1915/1917 synthase